MNVLLPPRGALVEHLRDPVGSALGRMRIAPRHVLAVLALFAISTIAAQAANGPGVPGAFSVLVKWAPLIVKGFVFNVFISVFAMTIGTFVGMFVGIGQVWPNRVIERTSYGFTHFFRNAPWLVLLFFSMFLIPFQIHTPVGTLPFPDWIKATIGLSLPVMANVSEIVRGGVLSIPRTQWESAASLGFSRRQTLWMVILPQCLKRMLPPWMNLYALLTMSTTLASVVGVNEALTSARNALGAETRTDLLVPFYSFVLLLFFAYCYPISRYTFALERRFAVNQ